MRQIKDYKHWKKAHKLHIQRSIKTVKPALWPRLRVVMLSICLLGGSGVVTAKQVHEFKAKIIEKRQKVYNGSTKLPLAHTAKELKLRQAFLLTEVVNKPKQTHTLSGELVELKITSSRDTLTIVEQDISI